MIVLDTREPETLELLLSQRGVKVERRKLEAGDLLISRILIERKTVLNFYSSVVSGELWSQLEKMKRMQDVKPYLAIISGLLEPRKHKVVTGALASVILKWEIPVLAFLNEEEFLDFVVSLDKAVGTPSSSLRPVLKSRSEKPSQELENMLCQISGVGLVTARLLLSRFKTLKNLVNADKEELEELKLRKGLAEHLLSLFNLEWKRESQE